MKLKQVPASQGALSRGCQRTLRPGCTLGPWGTLGPHPELGQHREVSTGTLIRESASGFLSAARQVPSSRLGADQPAPGCERPGPGATLLGPRDGGGPPGPTVPGASPGPWRQQAFRESSLRPCFGGGGLSSATWGPAVALRGSWGGPHFPEPGWRWPPSQEHPYGSPGCTGMWPVFTDPSGLGRVTRSVRTLARPQCVLFVCASQRSRG